MGKLRLTYTRDRRKVKFPRPDPINTDPLTIESIAEGHILNKRLGYALNYNAAPKQITKARAYSSGFSVGFA